MTDNLGDQLHNLLKRQMDFSYTRNPFVGQDLDKLLKNDTFSLIMNQSPFVISIYGVREGCYLFFNNRLSQELGYNPANFIGKEGANFALAAVKPEHTNTFVKEFLTAGIGAFAAEGSREKALDLSFTTCVELINVAGVSKWYFMETSLLDADEKGQPLYTIFNITNVHAIKKDTMLYFTIKRRLSEGGYEIVRSITVPGSPEDLLLTKREIEILLLLKQGKTSDEIANTLCLSHHTITSHRKNMLSKTKSKNTSELLSLAMIRGWI